MSHGHPTFKVRKTTFAVYGIYSPSVAFKADLTLHAELEGDERFFPTPYMAHKGWLSMRLDADTDWGEVKRLVEQSYQQAAN
jgi:predicted DNA-binding protein (MmcQ/YjbR family)